MLRSKGKLVAPRVFNRPEPVEILKRAEASSKLKLGLENWEKLRANYLALSVASKRKRKRLEDGLIMALLQQNLSFAEIRSIFKCGNTRISRIKNIINNPKVLEKKRPIPKHAITDEDLKVLMEHISGYETEDGFPCAHRRILKFFIVQGLTWTRIWSSYKRAAEAKDPPRRFLSRVR